MHIQGHEGANAIIICDVVSFYFLEATDICNSHNNFRANFNFPMFFILCNQKPKVQFPYLESYF